MADPVYIVTLKKGEDLDRFYSDMSSDGYKIQVKRPLSRNTHYYMTESQADTIRSDSRVQSVMSADFTCFKAEPTAIINDTPYTIAGADFAKVDNASNVTANHRQWGHLHCGGTGAQRRKGTWGVSGTAHQSVNDTLSVYNNGKHVDVIICDNVVAPDLEEWQSPTTGQTRFVQYEWLNELNTYVASLDDDGASIPTGSCSYPLSADSRWNLYPGINHGIHVCGTVAGKHYGWANEANIYSFGLIDSNVFGGTDISFLLHWDYLRAFHRYKAINPATGFKNPTITNHSWGLSHVQCMWTPDIKVNNITEVHYGGTTYTPASPGPSGWTMSGLCADFDIGFKPGDPRASRLPFAHAAIDADIEDAIADGIVVITAAGNSSFHIYPHGHPNHGDYFKSTASLAGTGNADNVECPGTGTGTFYYHKGSTPSSAKGVINVGAQMDRDDFRKSDFSCAGPKIDVYAPGSGILSNIGGGNQNSPLDTKYTTVTSRYDSWDGTSMASPQVCGVVALAATNKRRFTQTDAKAYLERTSLQSDMTKDAGDFIDSGQGMAPGWARNFRYPVSIGAWPFNSTTNFGLFGHSDQKGEVNSNNGAITLVKGDTLELTQDYYDNPYVFSSNNTSSSNGYQFDSGYDLTQSFSGSTAYDPTLITQLGKRLTIYANGNFNSHPLFIKTSASTGTGDLVTGTTMTHGCLFGALQTEEMVHEFSGSGSWLGSTLYDPSNPVGITGDGWVRWYPQVPAGFPWGYEIVSGGSADNRRQDATYTQVGINEGGDPNYVVSGSGNSATWSITGGKVDDFTILKDPNTGKDFAVNDTITFKDAMFGGGGAPDLVIRITSLATSAPAGTYYYQCQHHAGMGGQITVGAENAIQGNNHPVWIKTAATTGTGDAVTVGVTNNGASVDGAVIEWDTSNATPGTYYYQCQNHSGMGGQIVLLAQSGKIGQAGNYADVSHLGGVDWQLRVENPRVTSLTGHIDRPKGSRHSEGNYLRDGVLFPRSHSLFG